MDFLEGKKTYIVALITLATGVAKLFGLDVPGTEDASATELIMAALGLAGLRSGVKKAEK